MSGNATEEYLLTRLDHPSHGESDRLPYLAGYVVALVVGLACYIDLGILLAVMLGAATGLVVGVLVHRRIAGQRLAREVLRMQGERDLAEADTARRIAKHDTSGEGT